MGVVYLGRDPVIGRMVALKTIRLVAEDDEEQKEFGERFLREAQAAGILSHPNIVTVHDVGEDPETHISFIAMEYVEGKNLKQLVGEKVSLSYDRIADIVGQVAEALDYAHRKGIVHRDVKPANVIITSEGAVKITDFGIAKVEKSSLTSEGQFLGTPNYMSPEQVTGDAVDGRSDLFSLGVVLYELLTKKKPFAGENLTSISYKIVHEAFAPPETFDAEVPPEFGPILKRALAKNPADRYQRGREFALALYEFKARQEEREMLRDLGQMVAAAENLGGVAAVDLPPTLVPPPAPVSGIQRPGPSPAQTVMIPATVPEAGGFELGAVRGEPVAVAGHETPAVDYSEPGLVLETGPGAPPPPPPAPDGDSSAASRGRAVPARMEPVAPPPSDPLDGVTERLDLSKHAAFLAGAPAVPPPAPAPPPPAAPRPGVSEKTEKIETGAPPRPAPPPVVAPPPPPVDATKPSAPRGAPTPPPAPAAPPTPAAAVPATPALPPPPAAAAVPAEKPAPAEMRANLRREVNPRFVVLILGGVALLAIVIMGILVGRQRAIDPGKPPAAELATQTETRERRRLMADGEQMAREGKYDEALARFRELARRAPESVAAREAVARTEKMLGDQQAQRDAQAKREEEIRTHLAAAREAEGVPDDARVVSEAQAVLALDPASADAKALQDAAEARLAKKSAAEKRKEAALAAAKRRAKPTAAPQPSVIAAATHTAPPAPVATPGTMTMRITFPSPVPRGLLMVGVGDSIVFRKDFDFGKSSSGGLVEGSATVPSGQRTVKVWLIATDRSLKPYTFADVVLPGGETKTLAISLNGSQKLTFGLR